MSERKRSKVRGEGTVFQRSDGSWIARYQHAEYTRGKPISRRAKSEREAYKKLEELKQQLFGGKLVDGTTTDTVQEYMNRWLINYKYNKVKPQTFDRIESTINTHIYPNFGPFKIASLSTDEIQEHLNDLFDSGKSFSTVKKVYDAFNECCRLAVVKGDLKRNPMDGVALGDHAKSDKARKSAIVQYYTPKEEKKLIEAASSTFKTGRPMFRSGLSVPLILNTGLRVGELAALKWNEDIDFDAGTITIDGTQVKVKNRSKKKDSAQPNYILIDQEGAKSDSSRRILQMNKTARFMLEQLKKTSDGSEYVFGSTNKTSLSITHFDRMMKAICKRAGFSEDRTFGMHALRHTFASKLFAKGVDVKIVSELLGHSDVQTTYNIYIHIIDEQRKKAIHVIDDI